MQLTTTLQGLALYFRHSGLFYYFTVDLQGNYTYVNPLFQHTFYHITPDFYSVPSADTFIAADRDSYKKALRQCQEDPTNRISIDLHMRLSNGVPARIRWEFSLVVDTENKPEYIQGVGTTLEDPSEMIGVEKQFRSQSIILKNVSDTIVTTDLERKVTSWNKVAEKITGITATEAIGKRTQDILDTSYAPCSHEEVAEIVFRDGIWRGEMSFTGYDGERKYFLHTVSLLYDEKGKKLGLLGVGKDITERKKAEYKLQESELFYRNMISHSLDGIIMTGEDARIHYCAPSVTVLTGYRPEQLLGHEIFEFIHPDDIPAAREAFVKELQKQNELSYILLRLKNSNDNWVWYSVRGHNLLNNPSVNSFVIYFADDSKRKETEDKLKESEKHFRDLIYNLNQGVVLQNSRGELIACNLTAQNILGFSEEELTGITSLDTRWNVIHEDGSDFPGETHPGPVAASTKKPVRDVIMGVLRPGTDERIWLYVNADPNLDNNGNLINVVISFTDLTEQRKLSQQLIDQEIQKQKQLTQATIDGQERERLEIGKELHDNINQHLTTTRLYLEVAKEQASGPIQEMIQLSHQMLIGIINEIRRLSQSLVPPTLGDIGLVESVQDLCATLIRAHKFTIEFYHRHFYEEQMPANMKLMFFRIIQEQVSNIIHHAEAGHIHIRLLSDAENIILTINDNGKGFDPANYKKGLGFSNILNRASLFNGKMELDAAPGKGCTLTVIIPIENLVEEHD